MSSFELMATVMASTRRSGGISDGLEAAYAEEIVSLKCLPLDPVSAEIAQGFEGLSFREILQTQVEGGLDIVEGDLLVVDSVEYPIRAIEDWTWPPDGKNCMLLYLENRK